MSEILEPLLTSSLRNRTKTIHGTLDEHLMKMGLFSNIEKYKLFLTLQFLIHNDANHLYSNSDLAAIVPNLRQRNRFEKVKEDMHDLNIIIPSTPNPPLFTNISSAIGALYVVEGSKLGAKSLLYYVSMIGLSDKYGAKHLGADKDGRGASWRSFQTAIDSANIDIPAAVHSAEKTFERVFAHVHHITG